MGAPVGMRMPGGLRMPGGMRMPGGRAGRAGGVGGLGLIVIALIAIFLGVDPSFLFQDGTAPGPSYQQSPAPRSPAEDELKEFVSVVLADTEETWHTLFEQLDRTYQEPVLVLFSGAVESACGFANAAVGPFYCPGDRQGVHRPRLLRGARHPLRRTGRLRPGLRPGARGRPSRAERCLGISDQVRSVRATLGEADANALSVRQELQADCFAGIWAHYADRMRQILEPGDIEEGLKAASAIGDDQLQRQAQGYVVPESFTHGSSEQRMRWFEAGYNEGALGACDTFSPDQL